MPWVNYAAREVWFRIVFFGPSGAGKRATFEALAAACAPERGGSFARRRLVEIPSPEERRDILQMELTAAGLAVPSPPGFSPVLLLWTQRYPDGYEGNRKLAGNPDAVVFVMDSRPSRQEQNAFWLREAASQCQPPSSAERRVVQYNHRDAPDALPLDALDAALNAEKHPSVATVAASGLGVVEVLTAACARLR